MLRKIVPFIVIVSVIIPYGLWLSHKIEKISPSVETKTLGTEHRSPDAGGGKKTLNTKKKKDESGLPGRWRKTPRSVSRAAPLRKAPARSGGIESLPYLRGYYPAPDQKSVVLHDRSKAFPGLNLVVSGHAAEAFVMDMDGKVLHRWRRGFGTIWPYLKPKEQNTHWRRVHLLENGDLFAIYENWSTD